MPILEVPPTSSLPICCSPNWVTCPHSIPSNDGERAWTFPETHHISNLICSLSYSEQTDQERAISYKTKQTNRQTNSRQTNKHTSAKYRDEGQSESLVLSAVNNSCTPQTILAHAAQRVYKLPVACFSHDFPTVVVLAQCE